MRIVKIQFNRIDSLVFLSFLIISVAIFGYFLIQNSPVSYYDEKLYSKMGKLISEIGLFEIPEEDDLRKGLDIRTYLYPTMISFFFLLTENIFYTKIFVSILQYSVYIFTIIFIANMVTKPKDKLFWFSIIGFGFLNPYLISASTLLLTDILSTCFVAISVFSLARINFNKLYTIFLSFGLLYTAIMIRPSSIIFTPILIGFCLYRIIKKKDLKISKLLFGSLILLVIFIPQLSVNLIYFEEWNPLITKDLYGFQKQHADEYLKYGTVIISEEKPSLFYYSGIEPSPKKSIFDLLIADPLSFLYVYSVHIFGVLDWSYVDTYIDDFYPPERIPASVFLYTGWFLIFTGIFVYTKEKINLKNNFPFYLLILSAILYVLFISTIIVESRFGYPIYLLLLPFAAFGIKKIHDTFSKSSSKISLIIHGIKLSSIYASFILVFFYLSFWLDLQTTRIDWFTKIGESF